MTKPFIHELSDVQSSAIGAGDVRHSQADIAKAQRLLGYAPTHGLAEGIAEAMPWYVGQGK